MKKIEFEKIPTVKKYSRFEYERRFLVSPESDWRNFVESYFKSVEDKYLRNARFRLRIFTNSDDNHQIIKLTKKYESDSSYFQLISSTVLSPEEYKVFDALEGDRLKKKRYFHKYNERIFSVSVFENELEGLILCETETSSIEELMSVEFPEYAKYEVTEDNFFAGGNLCRITQTELNRKLSQFNLN